MRLKGTLYYNLRGYLPGRGFWLCRVASLVMYCIDAPLRIVTKSLHMTALPFSSSMTPINQDTLFSFKDASQFPCKADLFIFILFHSSPVTSYRGTRCPPSSCPWGYWWPASPASAWAPSASPSPQWRPSCSAPDPCRWSLLKTKQNKPCFQFLKLTCDIEHLKACPVQYDLILKLQACSDFSKNVAF